MKERCSGLKVFETITMHSARHETGAACVEIGIDSQYLNPAYSADDDQKVEGRRGLRPTSIAVDAIRR